MQFVSAARMVILIAVATAMLIRFRASPQPHTRSRAVWVALSPLAAGAVAIQFLSGIRAQAINSAVGIDQFNQLPVAVAATVDFAAALWFARTLRAASMNSDQPAQPLSSGSTEIFAALAMTAITVFVFAMSSPKDRFAEHAQHWWIVYAACWSCYSMVLTIATCRTLLRTLSALSTVVTRTTITLLIVGTAAEVPYVLIRCIRWLSVGTHPAEITIGFWTSAARFLLVATAYLIIAVAPRIEELTYSWKSHRLRNLWQDMVTAAHSHAPRPSGPARARLHQQVIDINDAVAIIATSTDASMASTTRHIVRRLASLPQPLTAHEIITEYTRCRKQPGARVEAVD